MWRITHWIQVSHPHLRNPRAGQNYEQLFNNNLMRNMVTVVLRSEYAFFTDAHASYMTKLYTWHILICSALAVGDPHARVPYKSLQARNVIGLPPGIKLSHPSTLSQDQLQVLYDNIATIRFIGELLIVHACASDSYVIIIQVYLPFLRHQ